MERDVNFLERMQGVLNGDSDFNIAYTENGATAYRTTGHALLDLNFSVSSLRNADEFVIVDKWVKAYEEDHELALKFLFFSRDIRGGLGERRIFRVIFKYLAMLYPQDIKHLLNWIPEYGRWDDLIELFLCGPVSEQVLDIIRKRLANDLNLVLLAKKNGGEPQISLLAKWMPSINTSSKATRALANKLASQLGYKPADYRKVLSTLRASLKVLETFVHGRWGEIDYSAVPSKANLLYKDAFMRHDSERRSNFLARVENGEEKINAGVLFPHDIVSKYTNSWYGRGIDTTMEELWKALPNLVNPNSKTIVVADGSGSMKCTVGNTRTTALDVANAIAIYFAERLSGAFKDKYITFSARPQYVDFRNCDSLLAKINLALHHDEIANTNIEAVFDLILQTAVDNRMMQRDLPANVLIISDMEFDAAAGNYGENQYKKLFNVIGAKFRAAGYMLPKLIFWNVNSRTGAIPVITNPNGVALVSGFSVNVVKMVMSAELDPWKILVDALMDPRYDNIVTADKAAVA